MIRTRKARILEAQSNPRGALLEYVIVLIIQQANRESPSTATKIDEINKAICVEDAVELMNKLSKSTDRDLPSKIYCKNFFETFPSVYIHKERLVNADRDSLVTSFSAAQSFEEKLNVIIFIID